MLERALAPAPALMRREGLCHRVLAGRATVADDALTVGACPA
jgi:hypothetical protein